MTHATPKKKVAIFGGSFNPPHYGHFIAMFYARHYLDLDEVWMLVTPQSPHKDESQYAPLPDRMEMCRIMADGHTWIIPTDIEKKFQNTETSNTLRELTNRHPDIDFTWIMGADNLTNFHRWHNWEEIIENYKMLILARPGEGSHAMQSPAAKYAAHLLMDDPMDMKSRDNGWCFINVEKFDISSTAITNRMKAGERRIKELFERVEHYIIAEKLYGIDTPRPTQEFPTLKP